MEYYKKELVSLITPCYNGEGVIKKLLNSILAQSYPHIEHIIIDDGSTDNTAQVIKSYIPKYKEKGYTLKYHYQENSGQSVAINNALKLFSGEYLLWPDSDDYYSSKDSIHILVSELKNTNESYGMARCFLEFERAGQIVKRHTVNDINTNKTNLFDAAVLGLDNFWYVPGGFIVKRKALLKVLPKLNIWTKKEAGQNFQLLFPILYNFKCKTIPHILYSVIEHSTSHSRSTLLDSDKRVRQLFVYIETAVSSIHNITQMSSSEKKMYIEKVQIRYWRDILHTYYSFNEIRKANVFYKKIKKEFGYNPFSVKDRFIFFLKKKPFFFNVLRIVKSIISQND